MYAGLWYYNKHRSCEPLKRTKGTFYRKSAKTGRHLRPRSEWIPVELPESLRIITHDRWDRVQRRLDMNRAFSPRNEKHTYLLKGLIRCGSCRGPYVGEPCHGLFSYRCSARCKGYPSIKETRVNEAVWEAVKEAVLNPKLIADQVTAIKERREMDEKTLESECPAIQEALRRIESEESRLLEAYRTGVISPAQLGQELEKINGRKTSLRLREEDTRNRLHGLSATRLAKSISSYCRDA